MPGTWERPLFLYLILRTSFLREAEKAQLFANLAERPPTSGSQPARGLGQMISKGQQFPEKLAAYKREKDEPRPRKPFSLSLPSSPPPASSENHSWFL